MNSVKRTYPTNKDAFRQNCFVKLSNLDDVLETAYKLIRKMEVLVTESLDNNVEISKLSPSDRIHLYAKLVDSTAKIEKVRMEVNNIVMGTYDEIEDASSAIKETADQKTLRKVGARMLALIAKVKPAEG